MSEDEPAEEPRHAVVLDYLPHGRVDDDRPRYQRRPLGHLLGVDDFQLFEVELEAGDAITIGDEVIVEPPAEPLAEVRSVGYDDLTRGAQSELEHAVRDLVDRDEARFVDFYNEAGPISLRLHQLNLLPGIGDKLRDSILEQRKQRPFESFEDVADRVTGLHDAETIIIERIMQELRDEDVKYKRFVRAG